MIQIQNTLVSLDVIETFFLCDLEACKGQCCIEGDAGAPLTDEEAHHIERVLPHVTELMSTEANEEVKRNGVSYIDDEGDRVTTILNGRDCAFSCSENSLCLCALEKAFRAGKIENVKPISCFLYPIRITEYPTFTAVNYHRWDVCRSALEKGRKENVRVYQFLKEPLIRRFGKEWWEELDLTARIYLEEKNRKKN